MTTVEKIEKAISLQNHISGVEFRVSGKYATFTLPAESRKYQDVGRVNLETGKAHPFSSHTRTERERDAAKFLQVIETAITKDEFPEVDTRPSFSVFG